MPFGAIPKYCFKSDVKSSKLCNHLSIRLSSFLSGKNRTFRIQPKRDDVGVHSLAGVNKAVLDNIIGSCDSYVSMVCQYYIYSDTFMIAHILLH